MVRLAAGVGMFLSLLTALPVYAVERQVETARFPLSPGGTVAVENVQGAIDVEGWDRAEVEVSVIKTAATDCGCLDEVRIVAEPGKRTLTLRTLYLGETDEPVRVDYRLRVPRQVRLQPLRTVNGNITVREVEGLVDARSLNGNIQQAGVAGGVVARAVNGNIAVSLRSLPGPAAAVHLETVNGHLYLELPPSPDADLELSTVAGRIEGNYTFNVSEVPDDATWKTRLGRGGTSVRLRTVRGNIRVVEGEDLL